MIARNYTAKEKTGRRLIILAWAVEILAALVGLAIAFMTAYSIYDEIGRGQSQLSSAIVSNIAIGALPFVMVAVVEITKIPLVLAFFHAVGMRWKLLFGLALIFLICVTFETALNGFERNFSNLNFSIERARREISRTSERLTAVDAEIAQAQIANEGDARRKHREASEQVSKARLAELAEIDKLTTDRLSIASGAQASQLEREIQNLDKQIGDLQRQRQSEIERTRAEQDEGVRRAQDQRRSAVVTLERQIEQLNEQIKVLAAQETEELAKRTFLTEGPVRADFAKRRTDLVDQLKRLQEQLAAQHSRQDPAASSRPADLIGREFDQRIRELESRREAAASRLAERAVANQRNAALDLREIETRKREVQAKYTQLQDQANSQYDADMKLVVGAQATIRRLQEERKALDDDRLEQRNLINQKVAENQVYRIAQLMFGRENAADVTREDLRITGFIWFGSLAAIVAGTGTILAFAGVLLMYQEPRRGGIARLARSLRALVVDIRARVRAPKIVTKIVENDIERLVHVTQEVPVDRIVFKEVPVEIVRKELVYVPLYTNDPALLGDSTKARPEIKDVTRGAVSVAAD